MRPEHHLDEVEPALARTLVLFMRTSEAGCLPSLSYGQIACCDVSIGADGPRRAAYQAPSRI